MEEKSAKIFWTKQDTLVVLAYYGLMCLPWLFSLLSGGVAQRNITELAKSGPLLPAMFWTFSFFQIFVVLWLINNRKKQCGCTIKELLGIPKSDSIFHTIMIGLFAGTFLFFIGTIIALYWSSFLQTHGIDAPQQYLIEVLKSGLIPNWQIIGVGIIVGIFAPFVEEVFFRGILFEKLRESRNTFVALLLSSAFFAVVHTNLFVLPGVFVVGVGFTLVYSMRLGDGKSGTVGLLGSMVAHLTFNMLNTIVIV